jgi:hypothetical protein
VCNVENDRLILLHTWIAWMNTRGVRNEMVEEELRGNWQWLEAMPHGY